MSHAPEQYNGARERRPGCSRRSVRRPSVRPAHRFIGVSFNFRRSSVSGAGRCPDARVSTASTRRSVLDWHSRRRRRSPLEKCSPSSERQTDRDVKPADVAAAFGVHLSALPSGYSADADKTTAAPPARARCLFAERQQSPPRRTDRPRCRPGSLGRARPERQKQSK